VTLGYGGSLCRQDHRKCPPLTAGKVLQGVTVFREMQPNKSRRADLRCYTEFGIWSLSASPTSCLNGCRSSCLLRTSSVARWWCVGKLIYVAQDVGLAWGYVGLPSHGSCCDMLDATCAVARGECCVVGNAQGQEQHFAWRLCAALLRQPHCTGNEVVSGLAALCATIYVNDQSPWSRQCAARTEKLPRVLQTGPFHPLHRCWSSC
jgi:hypothetical protein